jgi:hypothetical protein
VPGGIPTQFGRVHDLHRGCEAARVGRAVARGLLLVGRPEHDDTIAGEARFRADQRRRPDAEQDRRFR